MPGPLVGTPVIDKKRIDDLILWECEQRYTRTTITLPAGTYEIGEVATNETVGAHAIGAQPSFSDVLIIENITVPSGENWEVNALVRGPALLDFDEVVRVTDETDAALRTRLADLLAQGVRFVRQPVYTEESDRSA